MQATVHRIACLGSATVDRSPPPSPVNLRRSLHLPPERSEVHRGPVLDQFAVAYPEDIDELEFYPVFARSRSRLPRASRHVLRVARRSRRASCGTIFACGSGGTPEESARSPAAQGSAGPPAGSGSQSQGGMPRRRTPGRGRSGTVPRTPPPHACCPRATSSPPLGRGNNMHPTAGFRYVVNLTADLARSVNGCSCRNSIRSAAWASAVTYNGGAVVQSRRSGGWPTGPPTGPRSWPARASRSAPRSRRRAPPRTGGTRPCRSDRRERALPTWRPADMLQPIYRKILVKTSKVRGQARRRRHTRSPRRTRPLIPHGLRGHARHRSRSGRSRHRLRRRPAAPTTACRGRNGTAGGRGWRGDLAHRPFERPSVPPGQKASTTRTKVTG